MKRRTMFKAGICVFAVVVAATVGVAGNAPGSPKAAAAGHPGGKGGIVRPPIKPLPPIDQPIVCLPDLQCTGMSPDSGEFMFGLLVNFQVKLRNRYGQLPKHFTIELRLRAGDVVHKAQQYVVTDPQGQETVVTCPFRLSAVPGYYVMDVVVDVHNEVREQDENNNITTFGPIMIVY